MGVAVSRYPPSTLMRLPTRICGFETSDWTILASTLTAEFPNPLSTLRPVVVLA